MQTDKASLGKANERTAPSSKTFFKEDELAERWRISVKALQRWRQVGEGPSFVKIGRVVRYELRDVEAFEAVHRVRSNPPDHLP